MAAKSDFWQTESMAIPPIDLDSMSVEERLTLLERIWASLSDEPSARRLSPDQEAELDRRVGEIEAGDAAGVTWDEAVARIRNRGD